MRGRGVAVVPVVVAARLVVADPVVRDPVDPTKWRCEPQQLAPQLLTPDGSAIPRDGGVLVAWTWRSGEPRGTEDPSRPRDWRVTMDDRVKVFAMETLAPGVTVYRAPARQRVAISIAGQPLAVFTVGATATALVAPTLRAVHKSMSQSRKAPATHVEVEAELADTPPTWAIGVITYRVEAKRRVALAFHPIESRDARIELYADPPACQPYPAGMEAASLMDLVAIAWVDAFGRVSAPSTPVKVTE